ncbi:MAG: hypothetical protein J6113_00870 [Lachnospiraceae bacterium]|nr:hypothetical protein [Lachnospiraceae bacterium]
METLKLALSLQSAYALNSLIYRLRRFPVIKRFFKKNTSYAATELKKIWIVVGNTYRVFRAMLFAFLYYAGIFVAGLFRSSESDGFFEVMKASGPVFVFLLLILSLMGALYRNDLVDADYECYYAIRLLRTDAKKYILINYGLMLLKKVLTGFPFILLVCLLTKLPLYYILLLPLFIPAVKIVFAFFRIHRFVRVKKAEGSPLSTFLTLVLTAIIGAAGVLGYFAAERFSEILWTFAVFALAVIALSVPCALYLLRYDNYLVYYKRYLALSNENTNQIAKKTIVSQQKQIDDKTVMKTSKRSGFAYFADLFDIRHRKILGNATFIITLIMAIVFVAMYAGLFIIADTAMFERFGRILSRALPVMPFAFYIINRGQQYSQALFANCDRAMLHYAFYRKRSNVLRLFALRLAGIAKQNLPPALTAGFGFVMLRVLLNVRVYGLSGLEKIDILELFLFLVAPIALSIFFSIHYLMLYYLLQPFDIESKSRNFGYNFAMGATYMACYLSYSVLSTMDSLNPLVYGGILIAFCLVYSGIASLLVFLLAPKTFKNRV